MDMSTKSCFIHGRRGRESPPHTEDGETTSMMMISSRTLLQRSMVSVRVRVLLLSLLASALLSALSTTALDNGLGLVPPMGWNSWNKYGCNIDETTFRSMVDSIVQQGFKDAGYQYVNLDDCVCTGRNDNGTLIVDPVKFPSGLKALGDYVHSKGLKFGMYTCAGTKTCQGRPGLYGHDQVDANTFAEWGVDYIKIDWCFTVGMSPKVRYPAIRDAILATKRPMFISMCEWGVDKPWEWAVPVGNSWRTTGDINDHWERVVQIVDDMRGLGKYAQKGAWNDPDMLEVGNNASWTVDEMHSHMSLWALMNSPLIMGNDLTNMNPDVLTTLINPEVIAVNQDVLAVAGDIRHEESVGLCINCFQYWSKPLSGNAHSVILFNSSDKKAHNMTFDFSWLTDNPASSYEARCLWCHKDFGLYHNKMTLDVGPHGVKMMKLTLPSSHPSLTHASVEEIDVDDVQHRRYKFHIERTEWYRQNCAVDT